MSNQVFVIIIILIFLNFLIAITKSDNTDKKVKMTILWREWINGDYCINNGRTIYDTEYDYKKEYEVADIILHRDSEVLGLKKGRYVLINGEFVERLN